MVKRAQGLVIVTTANLHVIPFIDSESSKMISLKEKAGIDTRIQFVAD